jgi:predicted Ser/Thr protein kinase
MTTEAIGDGGAPSVPSGAHVGPYRLVQQLGEGGMGVVHLALDPRGRAVALKLLRPHIAHDPAARARLGREVQVLSRVRDPRVAPVIDADLEGDRPYVVTRYVPGPSLEEVVAAEGPMEAEALHRLGRGLVEALEAIHAAGIVHRDLKPANVLMVDGDPVLIDFGIAHVADDVRITMTGMVMGTPGYLAPEVVQGAAVTEATDWWGWAATLAFAATAAPPFGRGPMEVVLDRVSRGRADLSGADERLAPLLGAALSPGPEQRPGAREVMEALERYAAGAPATEVLPWAAATGGPPTQVIEQPDGGWQARDGADGLRGATGVSQREPEWWPGWDEPDEDDGGERDPRIGRPLRSWTLAALLAVLVAAAAVWPLVAAGVFLAWSWAARAVDRSVTSLVLRRHARGRRRSDLPWAVVASPWHVVASASGALIGALVPALVAVSAVFSAALAMVALTGGEPEPDRAVPVAAGALLAALTAWWGPGGSSLRRGSRSLVRTMAPGLASTRGLVGAALAVAAGLALWSSMGGGVPTWWPGEHVAENLTGLWPWGR